MKCVACLFDLINASMSVDVTLSLSKNGITDLTSPKTAAVPRDQGTAADVNQLPVLVEHVYEEASLTF